MAGVQKLLFNGDLLETEYGRLLFNGHKLREVKFNNNTVWKSTIKIPIHNKTLLDINLWRDFAAKYHLGARDYVFDIVASKIGSSGPTSYAIHAGAFPKGSSVELRLSHGSVITGKGGDGASILNWTFDYKNSNPNFVTFKSATAGGNAYHSDGVPTRIYLTDGATVGRLYAGGGGGGAAAAMSRLLKSDVHGSSHGGSADYHYFYIGVAVTGSGGSGLKFGNPGTSTTHVTINQKYGTRDNDGYFLAGHHGSETGGGTTTAYHKADNFNGLGYDVNTPNIRGGIGAKGDDGSIAIAVSKPPNHSSTGSVITYQIIKATKISHGANPGRAVNGGNITVYIPRGSGTTYFKHGLSPASSYTLVEI